MPEKVACIRLREDESAYWEPVVKELKGGWSDLLAWGLDKLKAEIEPADHNPLSKVISAKYRAGTLAST